ncbi:MULTISPECIES: hypothetical protein [Paenibacillus]|uniref:Uncharacterized protein n=1 Tax=Paenibacillus campinasensis TaxID=66347 RepID=A0A268ETB9_9BACL|nr:MULTISPECIES: hypothetical protein [Paenibacillus]MUG68982.1 hypothetical protein [Paenibacillus campinasensis]PAD76362.1 hypothetical protein CHH67_12080 [Paenibacillus campinasensis]PAK55081.1 hypothetical protein CHH75_04770 [Paenibacillus sp. 7541]
MWADLAAFIKANTTETLLISIIGTILVWMYKQFKSMIDSKEQDKLRTVQLKLGLFTKLETSIASTLHLNNEQSRQHMFTLIGECGPYLSDMQRTIIRDYYKAFDSAVLSSLQALIVNEVDKLKRQLDIIIDDQEGADMINYIRRLCAPFWPIILSIALIIMIWIIAMVWSQGDNLWIRLNYLALGITLLVSTTFIISMLSLLKTDNVRQGAKRWLVIIAGIISPALFIFIDLSLIPLLIQIAMFVYLSRSKRPIEIIRP